MKKLDKRFDYFMNVKSSVLNKIEQDCVGKKNVLLYIMEDLKGSEKLYGLQFYFTTSEEVELDENEKDLITFTHSLIIGDLMDEDEEIRNTLIDNVIDSFYDFDKLRDGYLVNHNFDAMDEFMEQRKTW